MVTATGIHPARRRRLAAKMPRGEAHEVLLRPLDGEAEGQVVSAEEQNFVAAIMADLEAPDWRARLARRRDHRRGEDGTAELSQPLHRRFHLVLLEAVCRVPGFPRVDPAKLTGMGMVLRREGPGGWQGWMSEGGARRGWLGLPGAESLDPEPVPPGQEVRPRAVVALERMIADRRGDRRLNEQILPLFLAPPAVLAARRRTILYAVLPLASAETTETRETLDYADLPSDHAALITRHLSAYLKERPVRAMPRAGELLDPAWRPLDRPVDPEKADKSEAERLYVLARFLQQLSVEFGLSDEGDASAALNRRLAALELPMERDRRGRVTRRTDAAAFVAAATPILVGGEPNDAGLTMPLEWPAIDGAEAGHLETAATACLSARFAATAPKTPKFAADSDRYAVRAFVRVLGHEDCPPRLVWSAYSEPFRIRPWWDSDAPPTRISLPGLSELKKVKPGVAFAMPPALANLLQGDMKKLKDGEGSTGGLDLGWICSFSIPIITLCAFIVLNIFLSLFDLIFRWMMWIKVCIPYPRPK